MYNLNGTSTCMHSYFSGYFFSIHCVPKMPKSKQRGASPRFIWHLKEGHIEISKSKIFFKSVEGNFWRFSKKFWPGFPRALPPGISLMKDCKNCELKTLFLLSYIKWFFWHKLQFELKYHHGSIILNYLNLKNIQNHSNLKIQSYFHFQNSYLS